jgi:hypothetical protein
MLFVNPSGVLCFTIVLFKKEYFTIIDVCPRFDGYDVNGNVINEHDWCWISNKIFF